MHRRRFVMTGPAALAIAATSVPAQAQQLAWQDITGPDGRYHLKMPRGYRFLHVPGHGGAMNSYVYMLPDKVALELVDFVPASPHAVPTGAALTTALEQAQGGMTKSWPGSTVREQREITTGPLTGREFVLAGPGDRVVRARLYLTPAAVYSLIAQGPMAGIGSPMVAEFFASLRFG